MTIKLVSYTLQENESHSTSAGFSTADQRGRHKPHNKTPEDLLCGVWKHISSFPTMAPHYCRTDINRKFLGADLNIIQMYQLYRKVQGWHWAVYCVKEGVYRNIFSSEFNLSFPQSTAGCMCQMWTIWKCHRRRKETSEGEVSWSHKKTKTGLMKKRKQGKRKPPVACRNYTADFKVVCQHHRHHHRGTSPWLQRSRFHKLPPSFSILSRLSGWVQSVIERLKCYFQCP